MVIDKLLGIFLLSILILTAYAISYDHILKDIISIINSIEVSIEDTLKYTRDYASLVVEFLVEELEETKISKIRQTANITDYYEYELVEDIQYKANGVIVVESKVEVSIGE